MNAERRAGLVSVIVPMKNGAATIERALSSVLRQTYRDWEAIVVDDGSADGSDAIVRAFAAKDRRIRLLSNLSPHGAAYARNFAAANARGVYIAFLDADDVWHTEKLERQLASLHETDADLCCGSYRILAAPDRVQKAYRVPQGRVSYEVLLKENFVCVSSVLGKAALFRQNLFPTAFFHEDYALWLTLLRGGAFFYAMDAMLTDYYLSSGSHSHNKLRCARERWHIYRVQENLSFLKCAGYFLHYIVGGVKKYYG